MAIFKKGNRKGRYDDYDDIDFQGLMIPTAEDLEKGGKYGMYDHDGPKIMYEEDVKAMMKYNIDPIKEDLDKVHKKIAELQDECAKFRSRFILMITILVLCLFIIGVLVCFLIQYDSALNSAIDTISKSVSSQAASIQSFITEGRV